MNQLFGLQHRGDRCLSHAGVARDNIAVNKINCSEIPNCSTNV